MERQAQAGAVSRHGRLFGRVTDRFIGHALSSYRSGRGRVVPGPRREEGEVGSAEARGGRRGSGVEMASSARKG